MVDQMPGTERVASAISDFVHSAEGWLSALFASVVTIAQAALIMGAASTFKEDRNYNAELAVGSLLACWVYLDLRHLTAVWAAMRAGVQPLAPYVALRHPPPPMLLRPLVALWWLAHFALALVLIVIIAEVDRSAFNAKDGADRFVALLAVFFASLGCTYCANAYLMLILTTFTSDSLRVARVWSKRFLFDLLIASLSLLVTIRVISIDRL
jgi:hypothetical protein